MRTAVWIGGILSLVLTLALSGCGGGSSTSTSTTTVASGSGASGSSVNGSGVNGSGGSGSSASGSGASSKATRSSEEAVATVVHTPITKATFDHWVAVTTALNGSGSHSASSSSQAALKDKVLGFLITSQWVLEEAAARGINVSEASVHKRLAEVQQKEFKKAAELQKYLAKSGETQADLQLRVKLELLESTISRRVTAAKRTAAEKRAALSSFQAEFQKKWRAKTSCGSGYAMEDCKG